jgi:hypothetical protein
LFTASPATSSSLAVTFFRLTTSSAVSAICGVADVAATGSVVMYIKIRPISAIRLDIIVASFLSETPNLKFSSLFPLIKPLRQTIAKTTTQTGIVFSLRLLERNSNDEEQDSARSGQPHFFGVSQ